MCDCLNPEMVSRISACVGAMEGIENPEEFVRKAKDVIELWDREPKNCDTLWRWLECCVTGDGEGYMLLSPAGGKLVVTDEQRRRIIACVKACKGFSTKILEDMDERYLFDVWEQGM